MRAERWVPQVTSLTDVLRKELDRFQAALWPNFRIEETSETQLNRIWGRKNKNSKLMGMWISSSEKQTTLTPLTDQPRGEFHPEHTELSSA